MGTLELIANLKSQNRIVKDRQTWELWSQYRFKNS
jgi:hypothetical protein